MVKGKDSALAVVQEELDAAGVPYRLERARHVKV